MMKNKLNAILVVLLTVTGLFASCSKDDDNATLTTIGFAEERFSLDMNNEATLTIVSTAAMSSGQAVPLTVVSNLVEGEDYELSTDKFTFAEGAREAKVTVTLLKDIADEDALEFSLSPVEFGTLGLSKATIGVSNADVILYTFDKPDYTLTQSIELTLQLSKITGSFTAEKAMEFEVELDPASTAVEGEHFSFADGKKIIIPAGQNKGTIRLNLIQHEEDKKEIVLKLKQLPVVFRAGNYDKGVVNTSDATIDRLVGEWKFSSLHNVEWWQQSWGIDVTGFPKNTVDDVLIFEGEDLRVDHTAELKVNLTGDLKNYLRNSTVELLDEVVERMQEDVGQPVVQMLLAKVTANVHFSAKEVKERQAEIGLRVFDHSGTEYLDVTIRDYEPTDFLKDTYEMFKMFGDDPVMKSAPLRFRFERVK
ncbi:DUF4843 domain-containing protein [Sphingobacterium chuzhouense]|uniref:DUF4843 domain-containing protein n=1 Tax=Sphingobacterium chuzhouense TaxID=1742264 RepID=A0ABR7XQQ1_9SPHI|nr:DUF4843 domain-containing protein [Sphingobacterium chuzhouense]MBD1421207.1 DUF4843 domain-containing protein [Sphingobacterium chuzhouense]